MELTKRQETILHLLVKEYIKEAEPISSDLLKKRVRLDISPATIRNELQELTQLGYVAQPHTSTGRIPTDKAYKYFIEITFSSNEPPNLEKEIQKAREKIQQELKLAQELTKSLAQISTTLSYTRLEDKDSVFEMLKIIGPSQNSYDKNISIISELLKEFENF